MKVQKNFSMEKEKNYKNELNTRIMNFKYGKLVFNKINFKEFRFFKERAFFNYEIEYQIEVNQEIEKVSKDAFYYCFLISNEKKIRDEEIEKFIKTNMAWIYEKHKYDYDYLACCQVESGLILDINEFYKKIELEMNRNL